MLDLGWMDEKVDSVPKANWVYKFACFFLGRRKDKLSYKELYLILYNLNRKTVGEAVAKEMAMNKIIEIYKVHHNGEKPLGL